MISKEALEEFKKIWREEKGTEILDEEATEEAVNLLTLYNVIYRPIKKEWMEDYERRKGIKTANEQRGDNKSS